MLSLFLLMKVLFNNLIPHIMGAERLMLSVKSIHARKGKIDEHFGCDKLIFKFDTIYCFHTFFQRYDGLEIVILRKMFIVKN